MNKRTIISIVVALALIGGGYFFGYRNGKGDTPEPSIVRDTIHDTIKIQKPPKPVSIVELKDSLTLAIGDSLRAALLELLQDSLNNAPVIPIPREQAEIRDSLYTAWVSGYRPQLDSIEIYQQTITIRETVVEPAPRWSFGIQGGVGLTPKGVQPYLGIGVSYRIPLGKW